MWKQALTVRELMEKGVRLLKYKQLMHTFDSSIREAEVGDLLSSRSAWSTRRVLGQPGLCRETPS